MQQTYTDRHMHTQHTFFKSVVRCKRFVLVRALGRPTANDSRLHYFTDAILIFYMRVQCGTVQCDVASSDVSCRAAPSIQPSRNASSKYIVYAHGTHETCANCACAVHRVWRKVHLLGCAIRLAPRCQLPSGLWSPESFFMRSAARACFHVKGKIALWPFCARSQPMRPIWADIIHRLFSNLTSDWDLVRLFAMRDQISHSFLFPRKELNIFRSLSIPLIWKMECFTTRSSIHRAGSGNIAYVHCTRYA